jgi:hypothetical protein
VSLKNVLNVVFLALFYLYIHFVKKDVKFVQSKEKARVNGEEIGWSTVCV